MTDKEETAALTEVTQKIRARMSQSFITADDTYVIVVPSSTGERAIAMLVIEVADGETPLLAAEELLRIVSGGDSTASSPTN